MAGPKYVKEFEFPKSAGFTASCGMKHGGKVKDMKYADKDMKHGGKVKDMKYADKDMREVRFMARGGKVKVKTKPAAPSPLQAPSEARAPGYPVDGGKPMFGKKK